MFQALCVGNCIAQQLAADQDLKRIGHTSRGCFLQTDGSPVWTVFLSEEAPRGPLTINLPPGAIDPIKQIGARSIPLRQGILHFSDSLQLSLQNAPHWQAAPPVNPAQPLAARQKTITEAVRIIQQRKGQSGITGILADLLPFYAVASPPSPADGSFSENLRSLISCLQSADTSALLNHLAAFLGQGSGLTPSGDDFLLGFFLTMSRWGTYLSLPDSFPRLERKITESARSQTTYLSANLIECAIHGEADQRLISALDGIMTAENCGLAWLDGILTWGNSSGLDAFAGMVLAMDWQTARL